MFSAPMAGWQEMAEYRYRRWRHHTVKLTEWREIAPHRWTHPDNDRR
jgi:hypothetical protein